MSATVQTSPWIINRRQDLTWFVGGAALIGFLLIALAWSVGELPARVITLWWVALDGPHVFSTSLRTVFDSHERAKHKIVLWAIIPLCLVGPLCAYFGVKTPFFMALFLWSHFHIAKQHVGFVMLYRAKEKVRNNVALEKWLVVGVLGMPVLYFIAAQFRLSLLTPGLIVGAGLLAAYVRLCRPSARRMLLVGVNCMLWWIACVYAAQDPTSDNRLLTATAAINSGHSLQYLRLNWFHNNNRYAERADLLGSLSRKMLFFFAAAFFIALPFRVLASVSKYAGFAVLGFLMLHFLLDARIWRVRGDKELARALRL